jgi:GTP diphosphokinase / guanosine-3',5'-bis(diphosphate) 3'-diphosphatase
MDEVKEAFIDAWRYAAVLHADQRMVDSTEPYLTHIGMVAMEILTLPREEPVRDLALAIQVALLHDTLEDTSATHHDLQSRFGSEVADGVLALTKNEELLPSKRLEDSLDRIQRQPREIWLVKMADRISNLQPPPGSWTQQRILNYHSESELILRRLGQASNALARRLQRKIEGYLATK